MFLLILVGIISCCVALFAIQNAVPVELNFIFWTLESSLVLVILGSFLCGILAATFFILNMKYQNYKTNKKQKAEITDLERENAKLQNRVNELLKAAHSGAGISDSGKLESSLDPAKVKQGISDSASGNAQGYSKAGRP